LPLVPLPQLLARGMSVFLKPFAGVLGIALVFVAVLVLGERIERALEPRTTEWSAVRRRTARTAAVAVGALALVLLSPPDVAIGIAICSIVPLLWVFDVLRLRESLLLFAGVASLMLLGLSFYRPERLAQVTIRTPTGGVIQGDLITSASGTWYLGQAHRNFVAVLPTEMESVKVKSGPHSSKPLYRRVLDALGG